MPGRPAERKPVPYTMLAALAIGAGVLNALNCLDDIVVLDDPHYVFVSYRCKAAPELCELIDYEIGEFLEDMPGITAVVEGRTKDGATVLLALKHTMVRDTLL